MSELRRVSTGIVLAFVVIALAAAYWGVIEAPQLSLRSDNPRLVLTEQTIQRGRIFDQQGMLLATTTVNYNGEGLRRLYPHPEVAPAVGYYSARYGVSGIEATYDPLLRGNEGPSPGQEVIRKLLHEPPAGGDVRLTLDLQVQKASAEALNGHNGAVVVATVPDGAIRAMVSVPSFNANVLDENWNPLINAPDAPLLNRVTQGIYQPGGILQTAIMAATIAHNGPSIISIPDAGKPLEINGLQLECVFPPGDGAISLRQAYADACPSAFATLPSAITTQDIDEIFWRFGLLSPPVLLGHETAVGDTPLPLSLLGDSGALTEALAGQSALTLTPLQALDLIASVANNGNAPRYRMVDSIRYQGQSEWQPVTVRGLSRAVITRETAQRIQGILRGAELDRHGLEESVEPFPFGHAATAYSGPEATPLQWYIGMLRIDDQTAIVTAVVVEDSTDPQDAIRAGNRALETAARYYGPSRVENQDAPVVP
jgi:peptidoglycan glycosyltransferase